MATVAVRVASSVVNTNTQRKLFQAVRKANRAAAATAGRLRGARS